MTTASTRRINVYGHIDGKGASRGAAAGWAGACRLIGRDADGVLQSASPMPTISTFYGVRIRMFFNDHVPPHFHARYGELEATIDIDTLEVLEGRLPQRALSLARERGMIHKTSCS